MNIPVGWKRCRVSDICDLGRGRVISAHEIEKHPGIYPVYSSQSYNKGQMGAIDTFDFSGEYVTWTTDGAYAGTVFYRSGKFNCTNVCGTLRAKESDLSMPFIAYKLSTLAKNHVSYVGNPKLMNGVMANIVLSLPTAKPEQTKIAKVLSTVDQAIEQTEALIGKQKRIKTGLMQDLLTRGIDEQGDLRSEETHQFQDSPLGRIPVEWEVYKLGHLIVDHQAGVYKKRELYGEGFNIVGVSDLYRHSSISGQIFRRVPLTKYEQKRYTLRADDLIYGESSLVLDGIAKMLWVTAKGEGTAFAWHTRRLCIKKEIVNSQYLYFVMDSYPVRRRIMSVATQTALTGITTTDLFSVPVPLPQKQEQEAASERLNQIDKVIAQERTKHKKLLKLKTGLMQDLLTGKVRVTELLKQKTSTEEGIAS